MMNSDWQWVQLGEISEVISKGTTPTTHGVAFLDSGIPFLRAEDVVGGAVDVNSVKYYVDEKTHNKLLSRSQLRPGDFLITIAGSLGRVGYVPLNAPPLNCNQAVAFVRLKPNTIDLNFLLYIFQYEGITKSLLDVQKVGTIGNLNLEQIRDFKIPLPPLTEQKRIASLLARADRLRSLRRRAHELGESLLQSVFLEMFGDLEINSGNWDITTIEEIATKVTDGEHVTPERTTSGVKLLSARNIQNGYIDVENELVDFISQEEYERIKVRLNPELGDVLMSCSGTVGRVTTVDITEPFSLVRSVALIKPIRSLVHPKYLEHYLRSSYGQRLIFLNANISGQPNIFQRQIRELPVSLPPLNLQEEFAGVVARVESLRGRMSEAERQVEGLFESLLNQSFGG